MLVRPTLLCWPSCEVPAISMLLLNSANLMANVFSVACPLKCARLRC